MFMSVKQKYYATFLGLVVAVALMILGGLGIVTGLLLWAWVGAIGIKIVLTGIAVWSAGRFVFILSQVIK
jgi:hypothetical protein